MEISRTKASLTNLAISFGGQMMTLLLTFAGRIVFIRYFSMEYLGINGLFTNILGILAMAELGIGNAMIYSLYKPVAYGEEDRIRRLMNLYRILYRWVALFVTAAGLLLVPFLRFLIKDDPGILHLERIYLLYLADSVSSYLFGYKQSIIMANQKEYVNKLYLTVFKAVQVIVQIAVVILLKSYYLYLVIQIVCSLVPNVLLAARADRMYPFLKLDRRSLPEHGERRKIFKNMLALTMHRIGSTAVNSTDNLIISAVIGLAAVGRYSNYRLITTALKNLLSHVYRAFTASIGNAVAVEKPDKLYEIFRTLNFLLFLIYGYCSVALFLLINPLVEEMFGSRYLCGGMVVFLLSADFYLTGMRQIILRFRDAYGLFWKDRYKPLAESALNLVVSIALVGPLGIAGVLIGTIVSGLFTNFWVEPYLLLRYGIENRWRERLRSYFFRYIVNTFTMVAVGVVLYALCGNVTIGGFFGLVVKGILVTVVYMGSMFLIYRGSQEMHIITGRAAGMMKLWRKSNEKR